MSNLASIEIKHQILDKIKEFQTIIIHRHVNPDADAIGSQGGMQKIIKNTFPDKNVFVVGEEEGRLSFLNRMDHIEDEQYNDALVIVMDTAVRKRISDERYAKGKFIIKIDHHPETDPYGDINWVDERFSSTSEMIYDFVKSFSSELKLSDSSAKLLFAGIVGDTNRFRNANTNAETIKAASDLAAFNFDLQTFYNDFYNESQNASRLKGFLLSSYEVTENGVGYFVINEQMLKFFDVSRYEASMTIEALQNIDVLLISALFIETEDEKFRVRIRSKVTPINEVAMKFGGGGHPLAAGVLVEDLEVGQQLIDELDRLLQQQIH